MLSEEFPVEAILEAIDNMAPPEQKRPKVILFDIGGVCVCSSLISPPRQMTY
jgi:hypothetical protein